MSPKASGLRAWSVSLRMKDGPSLGQVVRLVGDTLTTGPEDSTGATSYLCIPCVTLA